MDLDATRYLVTASLLTADRALTLEEIVARTSGARPRVLNALWDLVDERLVLEGDLQTGRPGPQYAWAARWRGPARKAARSRRPEGDPFAPAALPQDLDIAGDLIASFHDFVIHRYQPPEDKRFLALFQCSIRRPFSKSPSHASMRRAVAMATGFDPAPAREFVECPVHVVVLASRIGPVPYELEDFYPANVRGGGVKNFGHELYAEVRPVLVRRMAEYLLAHRARYDRMAAFGDSRYGDVMRDAAARASVPLAVFPERDGPRVVKLGDSVARNYWQRNWIQLYLEIASWLSPADRARAGERLRENRVEIEQNE